MEEPIKLRPFGKTKRPVLNQKLREHIEMQLAAKKVPGTIVH